MRLVPVRLAVLLVLPCALVAGLWLAARALADDSQPPTPELLEKKIQALQLEVQYLRSRDQSLTAYLMKNEDRAHALAKALDTARQEGFTQGAISSTSREALLAGLEDLAKQMPKGLPEVTKSQKDLLDKANLLR